MSGSGLVALVASCGLIALAQELPTGPGRYVLWGLNLLSAVAYLWDKHQAQLGKHRIPESLLHLLALFGAAGASVSRHWARHKTQKASFGLSTLLGTLGLWAGVFWLAN